MKNNSFNLEQLMQINLQNHKDDIIDNKRLLIKAVDSLHSASDILDELGLIKEAEYIENILLKLGQ